jgi:hypothetical protein
MRGELHEGGPEDLLAALFGALSLGNKLLL